MAADFVTGIDIGTSSIKAVALSLKNKKFCLVSLGSIPAPSPGMISDSDADLEIESQAIKNLLNSIKAPNSAVVIALPESRIFTRVVTDFPYLSDDELTAAIKYSSEEFVPLPIDQVNLYWQIIYRSKPQNNTSVFIVASPRNTINKYLKVFEIIKIKPVAVETELVAATRVLTAANQFAPTTLLIQFGASNTDYAVISRGMIWLTRSIATGGLALTRTISQYLNFELLQSEEYKKTYGLSEDQLGGKIYQTIKPVVDIMLAEAQRTIQAFQAKYPQNPIKRIVLSGGGANLPGLVIYFATNTGLEVEEVDPWVFIDKDASLQSKLAADAPSYTVAVGLAMSSDI